MRLEHRKLLLSDTVTVTPDGRTVVDTEKLLKKQHILDTMRAIRSKTRLVPRRTPSPASR